MGRGELSQYQSLEECITQEAIVSLVTELMVFLKRSHLQSEGTVPTHAGVLKALKSDGARDTLKY